MVTALRLALKNLTRKPERAFLTAFGVLLAVASFVTLLSITRGLYERSVSQVQNRSVDLYVVSTRRFPLSVGGISLNLGSVPPTAQDSFLKNQDILASAPVVQLFAQVNGAEVLFIGFEPSRFPLFFPPTFQPEKGTWYEAGSNQVTLGSKLAALLGVETGDMIQIEGEPFRVAGVLAPSGEFEDSFGFMPLDKALSFSGQTGYSEIWVQLKDAGGLSSIQGEIEKSFPGVEALTKDEYLQSTFSFIRILKVLEWSISLVAIFIALAAATNTMLMSTYERMREYGVLRAVGASRHFVFGLILSESVLLCLFGGCAGLVLGVFGSNVINALLSKLFQLSIPITSVTPSLLLEGMGVTLLIGLAGALVPATIVSGADILKAIKWE